MSASETNGAGETDDRDFGAVHKAAMLCVVLLATCATVAADLAQEIRGLDPVVLKPVADDAQHYENLWPARINEQLKEVNQRSTHDWRAIDNLAKWEAYRAAKIQAMRSALAKFPGAPADLKAQTTRTIQGDGFVIECLVFESRPRFLVTANLYVPDPLPASSPGIIIHPSHHNPKTQGELQDMGMIWARAGCHVLVMDQVGHGERRAHPFATAADYEKPFQAGRQDYWFRHNTGMQLSLIGDSLIGWQAHDLMRGVDLLLTRKPVDPKRIIMMGSVAGGGDPVAVAAALDERIACAVVFNFGGPQPETRYPLPDDAADTFNYAGSGSWESTRNMAWSARDGFLPWVIVGSIAPRRLVYAHEFAWDQERDPVWKRLKQIYEWHGKPEHLSSVHGFGSVRESGDKASHCNNIGPVHRRQIDPALKKWFDIPLPKEYRNRVSAASLMALTPEVIAERKPLALHEAARAAAMERSGQKDKTADATPTDAKPADAIKDADELLAVLRKGWSDALGGTTIDMSQVHSTSHDAGQIGKDTAQRATVHRTMLRHDGLVVPYLLLLPDANAHPKPAVAMLIAQHGKEAFLKERSEGIAALLAAGVAVCLPDVRGTGETRVTQSRGRTSWDTSLSASSLMLGQPVMGQRLRDLRVVAAHLRSRGEIDGSRLLVWGDSFADINGPQRPVRVPIGVDTPSVGEPSAALLATLLALFEDSTKAIYVRGGLRSNDALLDSPFVHHPHDLVVPGTHRADMLAAFVLAATGTPQRVEAMVNGLNQPDGTKMTESDFSFETEEGRLTARIGGTPSDAAIEFSSKASTAAEVAAWLVKQLKK